MELPKDAQEIAQAILQSPTGETGYGQAAPATGPNVLQPMEQQQQQTKVNGSAVVSSEFIVDWPFGD